MSFFRKALWFYKGWQNYNETGYLIASEHFNDADLDVDCSGKIFLITGANSAIGESLTRSLAKRHATVHMVCRDIQKAENVRMNIMHQTGNNNIHLHILDLGHPRSVLQFAQDFVQKHKLDVLIHNANAVNNSRLVDPDAIERIFATNTLAVHILSKILSPLLIKSEEKGRIVFVACGGMLVHKLDPTDIQCKCIKEFDPMYISTHNKRQQVSLCEIYGREWLGLFTAAMHPGWVDTPTLASMMPEFYTRMKQRLRSPTQGADTALWLAIAKAPLCNTSGLFYQDRAPIPAHLPLSWTKPTPQEEDSFLLQLDQMLEKISQ